MGAELFAVPFASALILICVAERAMNAVMCLVFRVTPWKQLAAQNVLVRLAELLASVATVAVRTLAQVAVQLLGLWLLFITAFVIFSAVWVTYDEYPEVWLGFVGFYNASLGPCVSFFFTWPLEVLDILLRAFLPLWDAGFWWAKTLVVQVTRAFHGNACGMTNAWITRVQGLLPIALSNIRTILLIAQTAMDWAQDFSEASLAFTESFQCAGEACLIPESRAFDLLSSMGQLRQAVALSRSLIFSFCSLFSIPYDLLTYPLLDLNFATGVHSLWNAVLQLTMIVPHTTTVRCGLAFNDTFGTMMCIPDFEPVFNYLTAGVSDLGLAGDNWANVAFAIVQSAVTLNPPACTADVPAMTPSSWYDARLFGTNQTAVVGLTEWMYAVTDGYTAIYLGGNDPTIRTQRWPYAMDASLGVAAVTYGFMSDHDPMTAGGECARV